MNKKTKCRARSRRCKRRRRTRKQKKMFGGNVFTNPRLREFLEGVDFISGDNAQQMDALAEDLLSEIELEDAPLLYFDELIGEYQTFSYKINGFLREHDVADYYSNKSITELYRSCNKDIPRSESEIERGAHDCIQKDIAEKKLIINTFDFLFQNKLCPRMKNKTVLFRGTDAAYEKTASHQINKSFVSTTKTLDNLFLMYQKGDKILSKKGGCCINLLVVDTNVPYLDLELGDNQWNYQKEVLLPRGLVFELVGEDKYMHEGVDYDVYVFQVGLSDSEGYVIDEFPQVVLDLIDSEKMVKLLTLGHNRLYDFFSYIKKEETHESIYTDIMEKIDIVEDQLDHYSLNVIKYFCSKRRYETIRVYLLDVLGEINRLVVANDLKLEGYDSVYGKLLDEISNN